MRTPVLFPDRLTFTAVSPDDAIEVSAHLD